jgi:hypothetical protein
MGDVGFPAAKYDPSFCRVFHRPVAATAMAKIHAAKLKRRGLAPHSELPSDPPPEFAGRNDALEFHWIFFPLQAAHIYSLRWGVDAVTATPVATVAVMKRGGADLRSRGIPASQRHSDTVAQYCPVELPKATSELIKGRSSDGARKSTFLLL